MNRPSGLAIVGYGLTATGFVQVAVTIAPRVAATIPNAGPVANIAGAAIALSVDVVWAALMHTTLTTYRNGQPRPAIGFGAATLAAVAASTALLAAVGHMGPWSVVPILAAILLVADGIREHVSVSPETAATIRDRTAQIRDSRALARIDAQYDAHQETISGYRESARLTARSAALAGIRTSIQRANYKAHKRITESQERYAIESTTESSDSPDSVWINLDLPEPVNDSSTTKPAADQPVHPNQPGLSIVPATNDDELVTQILMLSRKGMSQRKIAEQLKTNQSKVNRVIRSNSRTA